MRSRLILSLVGLAALCSAPAHARDVIRLQPTSKWVVNYAEDTCKLGREFGAGPQKVTLLLEQFAPGDWFKLSFVGDSIRPVSDFRPIHATVRFGPHEDKIETAGVPATIGETRAFIPDSLIRVAPLSKADQALAKAAEKRRDWSFEYPAIERAREQAATWVELGRVLRFDLVLETGSMGKPLEALRACSWDTVKSWGLPVEQQKTLRRKAAPVGSPASWFSSDDYPRDMLIGGFEGFVNFRVIVDEMGRPVSCNIQSSSRPREFEKVVCAQLMKRGKFQPALDATGKAVRSYWRQSVYFRLG